MTLIALRDLPGVADVEDELQRIGRRSTPSWEVFEQIEALAIALFGIENSDTHTPLTEDWEDQFDALSLMRDESDAYWAARGWDVTDGNGNQLRLMDFVGHAMICAVNGTHPDARLAVQAASESEAWGVKLEEEARRFKHRP